MNLHAMRTVRQYWSFLRNYPWHLIALAIGIPTALVTIAIIPPVIAADILDRLANGDFIEGDLWGSFGRDLVLYGGLSLLSGTILWRLAILALWHMEGHIIRDIQTAMFEKLSSLDMKFHADSFGGSLVSRTNKYTGSYIRLFDNIVFGIYTFIISMIAMSVVMWSRSIAFVAVLWSVVIVFVITATLITRKVRRLGSEEAAADNKKTGALADLVTNVAAVKAFANQDYEQKRFWNIAEFRRHKMNAVMKASLLRENLFGSITTGLGTGALVLAAYGIVNGFGNIGVMFLMLSYAQSISQRLWDFSQSTLRQINRSFSDALEGAEIMAREPIVTDPATPKPFGVKKGAVDFRDVTFTHSEDDHALFKGLDIHIKPGERIGLVGHSGSGKTTLTKLLLRYMDIQSGAITLDGQNIAHSKQADVRRYISYVPQEPLLFHRTLAENIAYGKHNATKKEIIAAAKAANAHEFIEKLADGYDTLVGERGVKLSGGQRQRVAIARAMLKDAPILVLDEATSALDSESEKLIQEALWKLMENRTAIVIAHRLSTIQHLDRVLVMHEGEIVEEGTHKQLAKKKKGVYAELWNHQSGGFISD